MSDAKLIYRYNDKLSIVQVNSTLALFLNGTLVRPLGALEEALAERCQTLTQERDAALEREAAMADRCPEGCQSRPGIPPQAGG